jgi:hypothetical protein
MGKFFLSIPLDLAGRAYMLRHDLERTKTTSNFCLTTT